MILAQPASWATRKALAVSAGATVMVVLFLVLGHSSRMPKPLLYKGIPIPFAVERANLQGAITRIGTRNNIDVFDVTYHDGEHKERLYADRIYLVHIPNDPRVQNMPIDLAMQLTGSGSHALDYYGYRYSDAAATMERRDIFAVKFADRFAGQFFASQTARDNDPAHGNALSQFESGNRVTFHPTSLATDGVRIDPAGALYVFIVNAQSGADLSIDGVAGCGNGVIDGTEQCDDGNGIATDTCDNLCRTGTPIPFGSGAAHITNLKLRQQSQVATATALNGSGSISLLRFTATAADLTQMQHLSFVAQTGSLTTLQHYKLWKDTNNDGNVDTVITASKAPVGGRVIFDSPVDWSGSVVGGGSVSTYELRADVSASFSGTSLVRAKFSTDLPDYVGGKRVAGTFPLFGIRTDGVCAQTGCQISVQTAISTLWTITDTPPLPFGSADTVQVGAETPVAQATAVPSQTGITLFVFTVTPSTGAVLTDLSLHAVSGSLADVHHFVLWRDTNGDGTVDAPVQTVETGSVGLVVFHGTGSLRTVQANQTVKFAVKGDVVASPTGTGIALQYALSQTYIGFVHAADLASAFVGVSTNGACGTALCSILVAVQNATHWNIALPVCGNGVPEGAEQCDDGGTVAGDGCSATCTIESGYTCSGTPSVCALLTCGNGTVDAGEECDDGNQINTDDCDNTCHLTTPVPSF